MEKQNIIGELKRQIKGSRAGATYCLETGDVKGAINAMHSHLTLSAEYAMELVKQFETATKPHTDPEPHAPMLVTVLE